jgi:hypothetical protein
MSNAPTVFLPPEQIDAFLAEYRALVEKHGIDIVGDHDGDYLRVSDPGHRDRYFEWLRKYALKYGVYC